MNGSKGTILSIEADEKDVAIFRSCAKKIVRSNWDGKCEGEKESPYFVWAIVAGVRRGWLDQSEFGPLARRAWQVLARSVAERPGDAETNAAALWAANALNER